MSNKDDLVLVLLYANWCGHCTRFKPVYTQVSNTYSNLIQFCVVNSDNPKCKDIIKKYVNAYPTILIFNKNGDYIGNYDGPRDHHSFVSFLSKNINK